MGNVSEEHPNVVANISESTEPMDVSMGNTMDYTMDGSTSKLMQNSESEAAIKPQEFAGSLPNDVYIYRQDVVRCSKYEGLVGIVTEVAGDWDSDSSITDDDSGSDDGSDDGGGGDCNDGDDGNAHCNDNEGGGDKNDSLSDGQVRVIWTDHSETTNSISDLTVVDREFLYGDIVAAVSDPTGQQGIVVDVNISVDLLAANGAVIKGVSSKDLQRVRNFTVGDYVVLGPWLGRVDDVLDNVTVLFDDGAVCKVMKADPMRLKPVSKNLMEDAHFSYYPGQRVRGSSSSVFKNSRWLSGLWKASRLEGTVTKVQVGSVFVYWMASANPGYDSNSATVPLEEQNPKNLTLLSCFVHANWQLGDWCLLPQPALLSSFPVDEALPNGDCSSMDLDRMSNLDGNSSTVENNVSLESGSCSSSLSVPKDVHESWAVHRKKMRKVVVKRDKKSRRRDDTFERALLIVNTLTKVDVAWQDGTREFGVASKTLIPMDSRGDHDFFAEQYVVEKASNESDDVSEVRRVGVVKSVNAKERTACVRWLKPVARPEDPREFDNEEVVSVYELDEHPDYDYCYGDVVVRLSPISVAADAVDSRNPSQEQNLVAPTQAKGDRGSRKQSGSKKVEHTSTDKTDTNFSGLSWVGNITDLKDGDIEVTWADGMVSKVGPQAIYVVGRDDDDESVDSGSEASDDDAASWETVEEDEMDAFRNGEKVADLQDAVDSKSATAKSTADDQEETNTGRNGPLSFPLVALGYVTRLATGLFSRGRKQIDRFGSDSNGADEAEFLSILEGSKKEEPSSQESDIVDDNSALSTHDTADEVNTADRSVSLIGEEPDSGFTSGCYEVDPRNFKRFDVAKDPVDHYFLGGSGQNSNGRKWVKKVQQDWSILEKNLPDGIYVRVYEDRMDLLRAVIVGAYGTPYQDGLFFFDFQLPPEYPQVPPSAHYHSRGLRLNPNLYEDGKVCLSLLNTWNGKGNEIWDPSSSSILQVLVSLQGLVLNSKPYFNEAGYDRQIGTVEGEKNSLSYNENTFLLNCKSMLYLLHCPPMHFEEFVKDHFRRRGYYILKACDAYMNGCLVGSLTKDACMSDKSSENSASVGLKLILAKILPRLVSALSEVGADCRPFVHLR